MNIEIRVDKINKNDFSSGGLIPKRKITYKLGFYTIGDKASYRSETYDSLEELSNRLIKKPLYENKMFPMDLLNIYEFIKLGYSIKFKY